MSEQDLRVLVVDDERSIRRFLKASLGSQFTVFSRLPTEKRRWLQLPPTVRRHHPDLGLPDMDGVEVTRRLREWTDSDHRHFGPRAGKDKIAALDAGADDYLTETFWGGGN